MAGPLFLQIHRQAFVILYTRNSAGFVADMLKASTGVQNIMQPLLTVGK